MELSTIDVLTQIENLLFTNYVRFTSTIDYNDEFADIQYKLNLSICIGNLVQKKLEALIKTMLGSKTCTFSYNLNKGVISVRTKFDQDIIDLFFTDSERKTIINFDDHNRV